jgi:hypothetical protein
VSKKSGDLKVIAELLGEDFLPTLAKAELYKPDTNSTVSHEELADALKVVPRAVMAWLTRTVADMKEGENRHLELPFKRAEGCAMSVSKVGPDVYHGEVLRGGKILYRFKYRSIPGLGLILLTTFELYDLDGLDDDKVKDEQKQSYLSSMIEERIAMRSLVGQVVEEKLAHRDAIEQLIKLRMNTEFKKDAMEDKPKSSTEEETKASKEPSKLKDFLDKKSKSLEKKEGYTIHLMKGDNVKCPDCRQKLFDGSNMTGCVCYGSDMGRKIFLKKGENDTMIVKFSKGWDPENVQMLLEALKRREK